MAPVAYTVSATFADARLADEWLSWLIGGHLAEVLAGGARDAEIIEIDGGPGRSFEVRYHFASRAAFESYERDHAPRLRADGLSRFPPEKGVTYRRSIGTTIAVSRAGEGGRTT
jgi:hypothetical protein